VPSLTIAQSSPVNGFVASPVAPWIRDSPILIGVIVMVEASAELISLNWGPSPMAPPFVIERRISPVPAKLCAYSTSVTPSCVFLKREQGTFQNPAGRLNNWEMLSSFLELWV